MEEKRITEAVSGGRLLRTRKNAEKEGKGDGQEKCGRAFRYLVFPLNLVVF